MHIKPHTCACIVSSVWWGTEIESNWNSIRAGDKHDKCLQNNKMDVTINPFTILHISYKDTRYQHALLRPDQTWLILDLIINLMWKLNQSRQKLKEGNLTCPSHEVMFIYLRIVIRVFLKVHWGASSLVKWVSFFRRLFWLYTFLAFLP